VNCNGNDADGCEINVNSDVDNCGACGSVCVIPHATPACMNGACSIASCDSGWTDCNGSATDGCEANLASDSKNCGTCGSVCAGMDTCVGGFCDIGGCSPGYAQCPGDPPNTCATQLGTNKDCAFCNNTCALPHATSSCQPFGVGGHTCTLGACSAGWADCDAMAANGCETNTLTDPKNCGSCNNACVESNGTAICMSGVCALGPCNAGWLNCSGKLSDGCNIDGQTDPNNCGGCDVVCNVPGMSNMCINGMCSMNPCTPGFADCNGLPADGCETNLLTSVTNCGVCGFVCNAPHGTPACASGVCTIATCNVGWQDCNGDKTDGCETNVATDPNNCGACAHACVVPHGISACANGLCVMNQCSPGFGDCDGIAANGCEVNLETSNANCGMCGNVCSASQTCVSGACT
jgi:hypothetical protein